MLVFLCLAIIGLYLISFRIRMRVGGSVDLESGEGVIFFSIFSIIIFKSKWFIENRTGLEGDLIIKNRKKRIKTHIKIDKDTISQGIQAIKNINFTLFTNLDVKQINLKVSYGNGDALKTMLYLGLMRVVFYSAISVLKGRQDVLVNEEFVPFFHMRTIKGEFFGIFKISIADIIYGFILSKLRKLKSKYLRFKERANMIKNPIQGEVK